MTKYLSIHLSHNNCAENRSNSHFSFLFEKIIEIFE